jgi:hypothetical protein
MSPLSDYSNLEKEISTSQDPTILPRGSEVKARIIGMNDGYSDKNNGAHYYQPLFDISDQPLVKEFNAFFWDLATRDKLDMKKATRALSQFKNFAICFGIDYSRPFDWNELVGKEGWVILGIQKDDQYGDKNTISKYVVGAGPARRVAAADEEF